MTTRIVGPVAVLALVALSTGCMQKPRCPELGDCGGPEPTGSWLLAPGYPSCSEDLYVPPTDLRLAQNNKTPALTPPPEPAVFDWCDQLVASGGPMVQLHDPNFYTESPEIGQSAVTFNPDGTYTAQITKTGTFLLDFPAVCVREFGAQDDRTINPDDPMSPTGNVCKQLERPIGVGGTNTGAYFNTICEPNPNDPGGCLCQFDITSTGGPVGFWSRSDANTLTLTNQSSFTTRIKYCNRVSELDLTGADGDYLFGVKGLRTFKLKPTAAAPAAP